MQPNQLVKSMGSSTMQSIWLAAMELGEASRPCNAVTVLAYAIHFSWDFAQTPELGKVIADVYDHGGVVGKGSNVYRRFEII